MSLCVSRHVFVCAASVGIDGDDPDHIKWIYEHAVDRANQYGITGVDYRLTQGEDTKGVNTGSSRHVIASVVQFC